MRKQYYFRRSQRGLLAWDVDRLVQLTAGFEPRTVPISSIRELDDANSFSVENEKPTWRALIEHVQLIQNVELRYPIILAADGSVMDGMHRVARCVLEGRTTIEAVQFTVDPDPDYVGIEPQDLPYD